MEQLGFFELMGFGPKGWGSVLLLATGMTVSVTLCGYAIGTVFGGIGAWAKLSGSRFLNTAAACYINVIRCVPELIIILLFYFGTSQMLTILFQSFGFEGEVMVPAFAAGAFTLGLISGAYLTEVFRGAYLVLSKGELEAARSVGMHKALMFRRIVAPQVLRYAISGMSNVWMMLLKESALISVTGLVEILLIAKRGMGSTRQPFSFYITAAILFLLIAAVSGRFFQAVETRAYRGMRRDAQ